jgi:glutamate dehydrogenase
VQVQYLYAAGLLKKMIDAVGKIYRTNLFMPARRAFSIRLDPALLEAADSTRDLPLGAFFVHGRRFNAFHVRFRDIARGGMRLVTPASREQFALESARHYDEVSAL